tara:strand:- start:942 stop:1151 length:210 start_codon:yes stop_codon:yes gene_type:complete
MVSTKLKEILEELKSLEKNNKSTEEGFTNIQFMGLNINRTCLILMIIYTLLFMYKEEIMKTNLVKNIMK